MTTQISEPMVGDRIIGSIDVDPDLGYSFTHYASLRAGQRYFTAMGAEAVLRDVDRQYREELFYKLVDLKVKIMEAGYDFEEILEEI